MHPQTNLMQKKWIVKSPIERTLVNELMDKIGISSVLSSLMAQRGLKAFEEAKSYFNPHYKQLHDPFLMKDMNKAVARITKAMTLTEQLQ